MVSLSGPVVVVDVDLVDSLLWSAMGVGTRDDGATWRRLRRMIFRGWKKAVSLKESLVCLASSQMKPWRWGSILIGMACGEKRPQCQPPDLRCRGANQAGRYYITGTTVDTGDAM